MKLEFWDIDVTCKGNEVYFKDKILDASIDYDGDFNSFSEDIENKNFRDAYLFNLKENIYYYILADEKELFGVLCIYAEDDIFFDIMEHDDRVRVKTAFPHLNCYIIGE